ncbi:hypothetical protein K443DRAFT_488971 [Laccaria amethystina LaAM-08-1]|jgi:hypothetical protein|uniref:Unplaced genomic scaffold K443scaffold_48, whole genome shotgun sequence n=1 Tax=Laccaria amethystina LaAM-08-1 TaxID=1095629 RepID=A0A0C9WV05_9AGAR|nr:hypothetical protein K443DRAFT_488971 [Laccaria amethystina LaAM-08-1]
MLLLDRTDLGGFDYFTIGDIITSKSRRSSDAACGCVSFCSIAIELTQDRTTEASCSCLIVQTSFLCWFRVYQPANRCSTLTGQGDFL